MHSMRFAHVVFCLHSSHFERAVAKFTQNRLERRLCTAIIIFSIVLKSRKTRNLTWFSIVTRLDVPCIGEFYLVNVMLRFKFPLLLSCDFFYDENIISWSLK